MRVLMAGRAVKATEPVSSDFRIFRHQSFLVAIPARHRNVCSRKLVTSGAMTCQSERGRTEALYCVAILAAPQVRGALELPGMGISMAIRAHREFDLKKRCFSRGGVAFRTLYPFVFPFQRVSCF